MTAGLANASALLADISLREYIANKEREKADEPLSPLPDALMLPILAVLSLLALLLSIAVAASRVLSAGPRAHTLTAGPPLRKPRRFRKMPPREHSDKALLAQRGLPILDNRSQLLRFLNIKSGHLRSYTRNEFDFDNAGRLPTDHYSIRLIPKRDGTQRVLLAPKKRLKAMQRRIDQEILSRVIPHAAATAFHSGGGLRANATPHQAKELLVKIDLKDFFPSITIRRVSGVLQKIGYNKQIARNLAAICTVPCLTYPTRFFYNALGQRPDSEKETISNYFATFHRPHLPQGAPTSPRISNLVCHRLDTRLARFAERFGADYTRYADDISFSGNRDFSDALKIFLPRVRSIIRDEGFRINNRKTAIIRKSHRQVVTGVVVNEKTTINRIDRRVLRSIIHQLEVGKIPFRPDGGPISRDWMEGKLGHWHSLDPQGALALRRRWLAVRDRI